MPVSVAGKRIKTFKKRHEFEPDQDDLDGDNDRHGTDADMEDEG